VFHRIASKFRTVIRTIGANANRAPWVAPVAILVFLMLR
jgi:hypothetical protein